MQSIPPRSSLDLRLILLSLGGSLVADALRLLPYLPEEPIYFLISLYSLSLLFLSSSCAFF